MRHTPDTLHAMLRAALTAQVDIGLDEMIVPALPKSDISLASSPAPTDEAWADSLPKSHVTASPVNMFGGNPGVPVEPEYGSLEVQREAICNCQKCPLGKSRTKFVFGAGSPTADLMFIGEAPGHNEDLQGEPFVGAAGQLLDKIVAAIGLTRDEIYIANILKCRPPNNRDPLPEEMEACFPYLREQVRQIRPNYIVALGRIAAQALLATKTPLGRLRGRWHEYEGTPLLATYHPAALLRFPAYKRDTWEDMQMVMEKMKNDA